MHIMAQGRLKEFARWHPDARSSLTAWITVAGAENWRSIQEVRASWPSADAAGKLTIFNIGGNKYRLITSIDYRHTKVFIRAVLTHADYKRWKDDAGYQSA